MHRFILLVAACWFAYAALPTLGAPARVAMLDFDCDDTDYHNRAAAADFSAALQAHLPKTEDLEWVEREELSIASKELNLSSAFGMTGNAGVRIGKWIKADFLVLGRFTRSDEGNPLLELEVLSMDHAEVLEKEVIQFAGSARPTYRALLNEAETTARSLSALVHRAKGNYDRGNTQTKVALLFINTSLNPQVPYRMMNEGIRRTITSLSPAVIQSIERASKGPNEFRVLRFDRPNRALEESELIVSGLVENDRSPWLTVADYYVWGEITSEFLPYVPGQTMAQRSVSVDIVLHVWDGRTDVKTYRDERRTIAPGGWTVDETAALCQRLVESMLPLDRSAAPVAPHTHAVRRVAQMLSDRADAMTDIRNGSVSRPDSPDFRRWLGELIQTLELACFFQPQDQVANYKLTAIRWGNLLKQWAKDPFRFDWKASEAWGEYVDRFGFDTPARITVPMIHMSAMSGGVAWESVRSAMAVAERFLSWNLIPDGMPPEVVRQWHERAAEEFAERAIAAVDRPEMSDRWNRVLSAAVNRGARPMIPDPRLRLRLIEKLWPRYVELVLRTGNRADWPAIQNGVTLTMTETGRAGGEKRLFDMLAPNAAATPRRNFPRTPAVAQNSILRAPRLAALPPELSAVPTVIHLPTDSNDASHLGLPIHALQFFHGKLWIATAANETVAIREVNPDLARELRPVRSIRSQLWTYSPASKRVEPAPETLGTNTVTAICSTGDRLWFAGDGVVSLEPNTTRRFGVADGLEVYDTMALASSGGKLFAKGSRFQLASMDLAGKRWETIPLPFEQLKVPLSLSGYRPWVLAGSGGKLVYAAGVALLYDVKTRDWQSLTAPSNVRSACADEAGVWLGGYGELHFLDSVSGTLTSRYARMFPSWQPQALHGLTDHVAGRYSTSTLFGVRQSTDAERLYLTLKHFERHRQRAYRERQNSNRTSDELRLSTRVPPGEITALLSDGEHLWIGCDTPEGSQLLLLHKPTLSWIGRLPLRTSVASLAVSDEFLWIGLKSGADRLLEIDKHALTATPRDRWLTDEVSERELNSLIKRRPRREQALLAFFRGDYKQSVELLAGPDLSPPDLEMLFLLAFSHDPLGLGQPEIARHYFAEISSRFPGTPWSRYAQEANANLESAASAPAPSVGTSSSTEQEGHLSHPDDTGAGAGILREFDRNGSGNLDAAELQFIHRLITPYIRMKPAAGALPERMTSLGPLMSESLLDPDLLLLKYDLNLDDGVDAAELAALLRDLRNR